jgi:hypothetical protein
VESGEVESKKPVSDFMLIIKLVTVGCFLISELFFFSFYLHFSFSAFNLSMKNKKIKTINHKLLLQVAKKQKLAHKI